MVCMFENLKFEFYIKISMGYWLNTNVLLMYILVKRRFVAPDIINVAHKSHLILQLLFVCVCICVCICAYIRACMGMHVHVCMYCMCMGVYLYVCVYIYIYMYMYLCVSMYMCLYIMYEEGVVVN